jgi:hypothetical protein
MPCWIELSQNCLQHWKNELQHYPRLTENYENQKKVFVAANLLTLYSQAKTFHFENDLAYQRVSQFSPQFLMKIGSKYLLQQRYKLRP